MNMPFAQFVMLFLSACFCVCQGKDITDVHSLQDAYARVAEKVFPAVVVVMNCQYDRRGRLTEAGTGSGFFVRDDGVLVTNHHVIKGAEVLGVKLLDGTVVPAVILGDSEATDIAVLKAEVGKKVPFLKFADTSTVKVGHYAIAVGAPHKLSHTMTTGVVSFKGRKLGLNYREDFIQTDAAINPGNSGGPLLNIDGLVIGVNDCGIFPDGTGSVGLGFAIDGNLVQRTLGELLRKGLKARPSFGATIEERPAGQLGVLVTEVLKKSPAEEAGVKAGDVILRLGKTQVTDPLQLQAVLLTDYRPGDTAELEVLRDKIRQVLTIRFGTVKK
ncbi:MAG: trypsin-like peptidase domain-containing protein [Victivallales bacterium]|nr:trypsin-like peptidase domain-containing protein [Victivallales bacterium]